MSDGIDNEDKPERSDSEWATLRRAEKRAKAAESELSEVRRQLAFMQAGVNPDDPKMRYFVRGYDGESDVDAIREAALEAGFLSAQGSENAEAQAAAEQGRRTAALSAGATPAGDTSMVAAAQRMEEAMASGGTEALLQQMVAEGIPLAEY